MSARFFLPLTAFFIASSLTAQTPAISGSFVSTLGSDTIQIERFTRTRDKLEGDIVRRNPRVQVVHYVADLSGGKFKGMSTTARRYAADPATPPTISIVALIADTTANVEVQRNGKADSASSGTRSFKGRSAATVPGSPPSIGVYEQILASNPPVGKDSMVVNLIGAAANNSTLTMVRRSRDSVAFISSFFPGWIEMATTDGSGRIQALDAAATTVKAVTRRASNLDFDAVTKSWAANEAARGPVGQISPADTVRATIGSANVEIAYSRPFKRGRAIFGTSIVPWNVVWRTGANAATQLTTSAELIIGNTAVPAGKYTLWTLPTPSGAKLIINSQTGQWGTDYDMSKDFARVDVAQTILTKPVEEFTFMIVPQGTGAILKYAWDDREYSIPVRVK